MSPFEAARRLLSGETEGLSLGDQLELVFQDADLVPLLVQVGVVVVVVVFLFFGIFVLCKSRSMSRLCLVPGAALVLLLAQVDPSAVCWEGRMGAAAGTPLLLCLSATALASSFSVPPLCAVPAHSIQLLLFGLLCHPGHMLSMLHAMSAS